MQGIFYNYYSPPRDSSLWQGEREKRSESECVIPHFIVANGFGWAHSQLRAFAASKSN